MSCALVAGVQTCALPISFAPDEGVQHPVEIGMGLEDMPYDIPNVRAEQCRAYAHTRVGWYRSVSNIPRAFAIQSITAEPAHELGRAAKDRSAARRVVKECVTTCCFQWSPYF